LCHIVFLPLSLDYVVRVIESELSLSSTQPTFLGVSVHSLLPHSLLPHSPLPHSPAPHSPALPLTFQI
ncbi:hypothetical protein, partial [Okeania sp. SIO1H5]|uniref:hypothetical protein n=1 Tax=Okeania sp. SIO1H5 TaxID=2607777 RepID=UPI00257F07F6